MFLRLPRGQFLLLGGDLAYPNPTDENYRLRFFRPYEDALPEVSTHDDHHTVEKPAPTVDDDTAEVTTGDAPLLFAIPGNHEWIDGCQIFRSWIMGRDHIGAWRMPQRTSYFVLCLPCDWYILCLDSGLFEDIDPAQAEYFLSYVGRELSATASVILVVHQPMWVLDAYYHPGDPHHSGARISTVVKALGARLRMRLCGDVHHYSRYIPCEANDEKGKAPLLTTKGDSGARHSDYYAVPQLVVCGGGGAFLHGPRMSKPQLPVYGRWYKRVCSFPSASNEVVALMTRVFGFRLINWKFDLIGGVWYFALVASLLPQPFTMPDGMPTTAQSTVDRLATLSVSMFGMLFRETYVSFGVAAATLVVALGALEGKLPLWRRVVVGVVHALVHVTLAIFLLACLHHFFSFLVSNNMLESSAQHWGSRLERSLVGFYHSALHGVAGTVPFGSTLLALHEKVVCGTLWAKAVRVLLRTLDVTEGLAYLSWQVAGTQPAAYAPTATRFYIWLYYCHVMFFYWLLATPVVSCVVGAYLWFCVQFLDCHFDAAYTAFRIEDFKSFLRLRLNLDDGCLTVFTIGISQVPKQWERDPRHIMESVQRSQEKGPNSASVRPSYQWEFPSLWRHKKGVVKGIIDNYTGPRLVDQFTIPPTSWGNERPESVASCCSDASQ